MVADEPPDVVYEALVSLAGSSAVEVPCSAVAKAARLPIDVFERALREWVTLGVVCERGDGPARALELLEDPGDFSYDGDDY